MNADQHPALNAGPDEPPSLTLVLPAGLQAGQVLQGLAEAIGQVRTGLAARFWLFGGLERECAASGDQVRAALCRGEACGVGHAAALIDEAVIEVFGLWDQYPVPAPGPAGGGTGPGLAGPPCPEQDQHGSGEGPGEAEDSAGTGRHEFAGLGIKPPAGPPAPGQLPGQGTSGGSPACWRMCGAAKRPPEATGCCAQTRGRWRPRSLRRWCRWAAR